MTNNADLEYLNLLNRIKADGIASDDRTGVGTVSIFGPQMRFDLSEGFPLLTTKRVPFGLIKSELLWFLRGDTNVKYLLEHNNHIWDEWGFESWVKSPDFATNIKASVFQASYLKHGANHRFEDESFKAHYDNYMSIYQYRVLNDDAFAKQFGELGPVYGKQWRDFNGVDQIAQVIEQIKTNPNSRRLIVSAWNPKDVPYMALPPCHMQFQFYVRNGKLSCHLMQRSGDTFLGVPFNIASYALLTHIIAKQCDLDVGEFVHTIGDAHIYTNHFEQVDRQLSRKPRELPTLNDFELKDIMEYTPDDFTLDGYNPHKGIKAPVAV